MSDHLVHWKDQPPDEGGGSVVRRRVRGAGAELVRVEIPAGTEAAEHSHGHEQFVEVLIGRGSLTTPDGTRQFAAGDLFHFPPDLPHSATFDKDTVLLEINLPGAG